MRNPLTYKGADMDFILGFLVGGAKPLFERLNLHPEVNSLNLQAITVDLETVNDVPLPAQFDKLVGDFVFMLLDDYLLASR